MTLNECLNMEYRIVARCLENKNNDFFEGVRALIVDKDKSPKWKPSKIEDVSDELVDQYFAKLPADRELGLKG